MFSLPSFFWFGVTIAAVFVAKIIVVTVLSRFTDVPVNRDVRLLIMYALMLFAFIPAVTSKIGNWSSSIPQKKDHCSGAYCIVERLILSWRVT